MVLRDLTILLSGVVFNDLTKLLLLADGSNIHYIDYDGNEVC